MIVLVVENFFAQVVYGCFITACLDRRPMNIAIFIGPLNLIVIQFAQKLLHLMVI
jgi:hypothetical protein